MSSNEVKTPISWRTAALLMAAGTLLLGLMAARSATVSADGLRYIAQAQRFARGDWSGGLRQAVDHPLYPLTIAAVHQVARPVEGPEGWQLAAAVASVLAGVLLAVPMYLLTRDLFGRSAGVLGVMLMYLSPEVSRVLADTLSESTFLLFWLWGVWAGVRFLRGGGAGWLVAALGLGALAYLSRPEGLLLPAALVVAGGAAAWWSGRRGLRGAMVAGLVGAMLVGPFIAVRGGIGTKPSVRRLLGLEKSSPADAPERERPLDPDQTAARTLVLASRAVAVSLAKATTYALLPFTALGIGAAVARRRSGARAVWLFLGTIAAASVLALGRLHATGGYCTPRHTLLLSLLLIAAAGGGIRTGTVLLIRMARRVRIPSRRRLVQAATPLLAVGLLVPTLPLLWTPVNAEHAGYREAGRWIRHHATRGDRVVDLTGWSLYYGERPGYAFSNLVDAGADPGLRWVVAREAHLRGPWGYCDRLRTLVAGGRLVTIFPARPKHGISKVYLYELPAPPSTGVTSRPTDSTSRR